MNQRLCWFLLRQMNQRATVRMLTLYSYSIALPGCVLLAVRSHWGPLSSGGPSWLASSAILARLTHWLQGAVFVVVLIGGSILVTGPVPQRSSEVLDDFAGRYLGRNIGLIIRPWHGALLLARLAVIVPFWVGAGLVIGEANFHLGTHLLNIMSHFITGTLLLACPCGALAIWLNQRELRWPLGTWLAIWIVPEIFRLTLPESPTLRTVFGWFLSTTVGSWGQS